MKDLKLGVVQNDEAFDRRILNAFPEASIVNIKTPREFLRGDQPELDAVVLALGVVALVGEVDADE